MKRKYMVKDKASEPYGAANEAQKIGAPFVLVSPETGESWDIFLTEPSKSVIDHFKSMGFEVVNGRGERCVQLEESDAES